MSTKIFATAAQQRLVAEAVYQYAAARGFYTVGVDHIVTRAHTSKTTLAELDGKDGLIAAVVGVCADGTDLLVADALSSGTFWDRLRALFELADDPAHLSWHTVLVAAAVELPAGHAARELLAEHDAVLDSALRELAREVEVSHPAALGVQLAALWRAARFAAVAGRPGDVAHLADAAEVLVTDAEIHAVAEPDDGRPGEA